MFLYQKKFNYYEQGLNLNSKYKFYILGLISLQIFQSIIQPLFLPKYEFLPLMYFSVYCACGFIYCWIRSYQVFKQMYDSLDIE